MEFVQRETDVPAGDNHSDRFALSVVHTDGGKDARQAGDGVRSQRSGFSVLHRLLEIFRERDVLSGEVIQHKRFVGRVNADPFCIQKTAYDLKFGRGELFKDMIVPENISIDFSPLENLPDGFVAREFLCVIFHPVDADDEVFHQEFRVVPDPDIRHLFPVKLEYCWKDRSRSGKKKECRWDQSTGESPVFPCRKINGFECLEETAGTGDRAEKRKPDQNESCFLIELEIPWQTAEAQQIGGENRRSVAEMEYGGNFECRLQIFMHIACPPEHDRGERQERQRNKTERNNISPVFPSGQPQGEQKCRKNYQMPEDFCSPAALQTGEREFRKEEKGCQLKKNSCENGSPCQLRNGGKQSRKEGRPEQA